MQNFMPWHGLAGGILIGLAAGFYLLSVGRIAGISGILQGALKPTSPSFVLNLSFLVGLPIGAMLIWFVVPHIVPRIAFGGGTATLIAAGLLVGFGSRIANGCTSGHGVCGLSRFSLRSLAATLTFMATAAATVFVMRHIVGA